MPTKGTCFSSAADICKNFLLTRNEQNQTDGVGGATRVTANSTPEELLGDPRVKAMLDVLAYAEGTRGNGDYRRIVNGTVIGPANSGADYDRLQVGRRNALATGDLQQHPNLMVQVAPGLRSSAAGRYQFLYSTWQGLNMPNFSPHSQDLAAIKLMQRRGMIEPLLNGDFTTAIRRGAPEWASLPTASGGSYYGGQGAKSLTSLTNVFSTSLQRYQGTTTTDTNGVLSNGQRGAAVETLQNGLVQLGLLTAAEKRTGPGIFGPKTEGGVKNFQEFVGLAQSGRYDNATRQALTGILSGSIKQGERGDVVRHLQQQLVRLGYMEQRQMNTGPGIFGPQTDKALKAFQKDHNLPANGVFNAATFRALRTAQPSTNGNNPVETPVTSGSVNEYRRWNVYSTGNSAARLADGYEDLQAHHDYQSVNYVMRGLTLSNRLEARDIVLTRGGESNFGQTVPSPLTGEVLFAGNEGDGYGNKVVIRDSSGRIAMVGHLQTLNVRKGENVTYGQNLGGQGSSGNSTGAHTHINADQSVIRRWVADLADGRFDGVRGRTDIGRQP